MKKKLLAVGVAATLGALSGVSNAAITVAEPLKDIFKDLTSTL